MLSNNIDNELLTNFIKSINFKIIKFNIIKGRYIYLEQNTPYFQYWEYLISIEYPIKNLISFVQDYLSHYKKIMIAPDTNNDIKIENIDNDITLSSILSLNLDTYYTVNKSNSFFTKKMIQKQYISVYEKLLKYEINHMDLDQYDTNIKEYIINLSFVTTTQYEPDQICNYNNHNYYKNKNILLQEFNYLLKLYNI